ncbi:MAG: hypothetical protein WC865_05595 [Bacteroidales bacterium]
MKTSIRILLPIALFSLLFLSGCFEKPVINYPEGHFSDTVLNLSAVNSVYDDYNSSGPPTISYSLPLVFSSNRYSEGKKFDLIGFELWLVFNQTSGALMLSAFEGQAYPYNYLTGLANTTYDEFGPFTTYLGGQEYMFLFASNRTGNMEMYFSYFNDGSFGGMSPIDPAPARLKGLNTPQYDAYATMDATLKQVIFASNRDGSLHLYRVRIPDKTDYLVWARADTLYEAEKVAILNSDSTDMFPYINGNLLVFSSKRSGGFGGYDLYYSMHNGTEWGLPVNFGPTINTASDEYRPVTFLAPYFTNNLMLFSSDRPGGKGGVDLYYVGISKTLE